jgi:hypothetical protein
MNVNVGSDAQRDWGFNQGPMQIDHNGFSFTSQTLFRRLCLKLDS